MITIQHALMRGIELSEVEAKTYESLDALKRIAFHARVNCEVEPDDPEDLKTLKTAGPVIRRILGTDPKLAEPVNRRTARFGRSIERVRYGIGPKTIRLNFCEAVTRAPEQNKAPEGPQLIKNPLVILDSVRVLLFSDSDGKPQSTHDAETLVTHLRYQLDQWERPQNKEEISDPNSHVIEHDVSGSYAGEGGEDPERSGDDPRSEDHEEGADRNPDGEDRRDRALDEQGRGEPDGGPAGHQAAPAANEQPAENPMG